MATKEPKRPERKGEGQKKPPEEPFFSSEKSEKSGYKRPSDESIIEDFHKARGNLSLAARRMGVSDRQVRRWVEDSPLLKRELEEARTHTEEWAASKLLELMDGVVVERQTKLGPIVYKRPPDLGALAFYLKTQHGWVEKPKQEGAEASDIVKGLSQLISDAAKTYGAPGS